MTNLERLSLLRQPREPGEIQVHASDELSGRGHSFQQFPSSPCGRLRIRIERNRHFGPGHLDIRIMNDVTPDEQGRTTAIDPIAAMPRGVAG